MQWFQVAAQFVATHWWQAGATVLTPVVALLGYVYYKRIAALFEPHADRHIDGVLALLEKAVPPVGRLRRRRGASEPATATSATPDEVAEPRQSPPATRKPKGPQRYTESAIEVPCYIRDGSNAVMLPYDFRWEWHGDFVVDLKVGCPNCDQVLELTEQRSRFAHSFETHVSCWKCGFQATINTPPDSFRQTVIQMIYRQHKEAGLL